MSEDQKKLLESQLWVIADLLRGKINLDGYGNYILGFNFYEYLSEKQYVNANELYCALTKNQKTIFCQRSDRQTDRKK